MFATFNIQKIKTTAELVGRFKHNRRIKISKNIRTDFVETDIHDNDDAPSLISNRISEIHKIRAESGAKKLRAETIPAVELVLGASVEFFENKSKDEIMDWAQIQIEWAKDYYKDRGKLITYDLHMKSEKTPHLHLIFLPENNESDIPTLSAKKFVGNRPEMRKARTSHANANMLYGLERGKDYYGIGEKPPPNKSLNQLRRETTEAEENLDILDLETLEAINGLKKLKTLSGKALNAVQKMEK